MSESLLPLLPIARGTAPLLNPAIQEVPAGCPIDQLERTYGAIAIRQFQLAAEVTGAISVEALPEQTAESWDELAVAAHLLVTDQIPEVTGVSSDLKLQSRDVSDALLQVRRDSRGGTAQIAAFLGVVPRVLFTTDFSEPNYELARRAALSKSLMLRWSKLDADNDAYLTYGVAYPKPNLRSDDPYDTLTFHTKWFEERPNGAVGYRAEKMPHIRGERDQRLRMEAKRPILGCPALNLVPRLFDSMLACAENNELFERTYTEERRNHGYDV